MSMKDCRADEPGMFPLISEQASAEKPEDLRISGAWHRLGRLALTLRDALWLPA